MQILEGKKIIIKLPQFHLRYLLSFPFVAVLCLLLFSSLFAYWYKAIRPFLWIPSAHVEAFSTVVKSDVAGRIVEIGPQEGDLVRKGQTLFVLDRDLILAKQMQTKRSLDALNESVEKEKGRIGKAMEDYIAAVSEVELGIGSPDVVKKHLALMEEAQEKTESISSQIAAIRTELAFLDLQAKKMTFTAPFDAMVLKSSQNQGSVVSFGDPVYVLCDPNRIWIDAEMPESEISHIQVGSPVRITLPAYPKKEFAGKVTYISPATVAKSSLTATAQNENIPIKVSIENGPVSIKPGLSARIGLKVR